jgi:WD40 repeat protein
MDPLTESAHPSAGKLRTFGLGQLDGDEAAAIEDHVSHCEICCHTLAEVRSDTFIDVLRRGSEPSAAGATEAVTLPPGRPTPRAADGGTASEPPPSAEAFGLPSELLRHPRYRVLGLLGAGGMGAVYKAEHRLMERVVALKVMTRGLLGGEGAVNRFHREVKAAARLSHANIVAAYDAEQAGDVHFLVMEYVEGTDLARWLARHGPLPVAEACDYVRQVALGLQHAHEHGMIHRDIKPHNLMRTPGGTIKILDFGLARLAAEAGGAASGVTGQGTLLGTVDYLAPEQADDAHRADIRSDIYSLGCTLYHLLSGRPPFPKGTLVQKIMAHTEREPQSIQELRPDLPPRLVRVIQRMMAKNPEDRYQAPEEVWEALAPFAGQTVVIDPSPRRGRRPARRRKAAGPSRRWGWLVAAGLLLAALGGVVAGAAVYRVKTDNGELVISTDNPDVEVVIKQQGKVVRIIDAKTSKEVTLNSGLYDLEVKGDPADLKLSLDKVTIRRGETVVATVERRRKPGAAEKKPAAADKIVEVRRLMWQNGSAGAVAFTPDGKAVAVASDMAVRRWDVADGKEGAALTGHQATIYDLAVSPVGKTAATADAGGAVKLWDLATGKEGKGLPGHSNQARGLAFSPDGKLLYSGGADEKIVRAWEVGSGKLAAEFEHPNAVRTLALSPDGKVLAVATFYDGAVKLWDTATQKELRALDASKETVNALVFAADGKALLTAGADRVIRQWETGSGKLLKALDEQGAPIETLARSPDGRLLLSGGGDWRDPDQPGEVIVWDLATGKKAHTLVAAGGCVFGLAVAADGRTFATGQPAGARLWRLPAPPTEKVGEVRRFGWGHAIQGAAFSPDGRLVALGGEDGSVRLWDPASGKEVRRLPDHAGRAYAVTFTPDGKGVVSAGRDAVLRLSDVATGKEVRRFEGHEHGLVRVAVSADGRLLLSGDDGGGVSLWGVETGKRLQQLPGHDGMVQSLAFAPDGKTAVSGGDRIRWWDLETGKEIRHSEAVGDVSGLAFAPDGRQLLSCHMNGTLRWWDAATGKELRKFAVQTDTLQGVALSADGRRAVTGGGGDISDGGFKKGTDFAVRLWDVADGKALTSFTGHADIVNVVALSPDGRYALSGSNDRTARLWRLPDPASK